MSTAWPAGSSRATSSRDLLTVAQVALSLMLLLGAGLMLKSFLRLTQLDPGFRGERVAAVQLFVYGERYQEPSQQMGFLDLLLDEVRALPGVDRVGMTSALPLSAIRGGVVPVRVKGRTETAQRQFYTALIGLFAVLAVVLAAVGLYGVISYSVTRRTQEIGIRIALGARSGQVQSLVMWRAVLLVGAGLAVGVAGALFLSRLVSGLLFGVSALDPTTFATVSVALAAVALLACWLPARRAAKLDPVEALHTG